MPQIIVVADPRSDRVQPRKGPVMFTERVTIEDFESQHFQSQLVERLCWAVGDAAAVEHDPEAAANATADTDNWDDAPAEHVDEVRAADEPAAPSDSARLTAVGPVS